jgi:hypothetical protein
MVVVVAIFSTSTSSFFDRGFLLRVPRNRGGAPEKTPAEK